jgi:hypothetical protein
MTKLISTGLLLAIALLSTVLAGCTVTYREPPPPRPVVYRQSRAMTYGSPPPQPGSAVQVAGTQGRMPASGGGRCSVSVTAKVDGNAVVADVACGGRPLQGAHVGLSSPLTHPAEDRTGLKQTQLTESTNSAGEARFDLSGVQADANFFPVLTTAEIYFHGEFDSGTMWKVYQDYTCPLIAGPGSTVAGPNAQQSNCTTHVDLKESQLYPTWKTQGEAARQAKKAEEAQETAGLDSACSHGSGESCWKLGLSYGVSTVTGRQYFQKGCALKFEAACSMVQAAASATTPATKADRLQQGHALCREKGMPCNDCQAACFAVLTDPSAWQALNGCYDRCQGQSGGAVGSAAADPHPPSPSTPHAQDRAAARGSCLRACHARYPRYGVCSDGGDDCLRQQRDGQACARQCDD